MVETLQNSSSRRRHFLLADWHSLKTMVNAVAETTSIGKNDAAGSSTAVAVIHSGMIFFIDKGVRVHGEFLFIAQA